MSEPNFLTKDGLLRLHKRLYLIRHGLFEKKGHPLADGGYFRKYDELGVLPTHVHRDRSAHARAVELLSAGFERALGVEDMTVEVIAGIRERARD